MKPAQKMLTGIVMLVIAALITSMVYQAYTREEDSEGVKIVATFYPLAYFTKEIGGEHVSVECLVPYNSEVHSWQPATSDIVAVDDAAIIVYNGAHLDDWFEDDILHAIDTKDKLIVETTKDVELIDDPGAGEHEDDGGDTNGGEDNDGDSGDEHTHDNGLEDPHTWISPFIAKQQAESIYNALIEEDPDHLEYYTERWQDMEKRFEELDEAFQEGLEGKEKDTIFVTHAAFGYIADRYGFDMVGVIGLSADEQPSTSTIAEIVDKMIEHEVYFIYVDPVYSDKYAVTLKTELEQRTGETVEVLELYFMTGPVDGKDYFEQQEGNLENLKLGLEA